MLISLLVLFAFGCLTGVTTVLFGFGGGFITVPVTFGFVAATSGADAMHVAVATSTAVMVVNSLTATLAQAKAGRLRKEFVWPLIAFVAVGAALGAFAATVASDSVLHVLFVAYLVLTIADGLIRKGFLAQDGAAPRRLGRLASTVGGTGIGAVASFLGVGGSVLTVPLLRRRGLPMAEATAMANPLSAPVAVVGTVVYAFAATGAAPHAGRVGYVDLLAAGVLLCGSLPTIAVTRRVAGRIPDRVHAVAYLGLLVVVTIVMTVSALTGWP